MRAIVAVVLLLGCAASPALAQVPAPETPPATEAAPPPPVADAPPAAPEPAPPVADAVPAVPPVADAVPEPVPPVAEAAPAVPESAPPAMPQRFSLNRVDGGFLRLDGASGQIAFCGPRTVGWTCHAVPEDRAALETEIARLQDEVTKLKSEIAALREPPPPRPSAELTPPAPKGAEPRIKMPSGEDVERARAIIEDAWRRIVDMIDTMRKDMMRKG